nr:hypothetical protein [uncultured Parabacteroides sp.]
MLMNELSNTKLIGLLSDASLVTNEEMHNAYEDFIGQVSAINQPETDYPKIFRILNFTRIEFDSLGSSSLYGQGEKCLKIHLS